MAMCTHMIMTKATTADADANPIEILEQEAGFCRLFLCNFPKNKGVV